MISTALNLTQSVWNSLIPFWQTINIFYWWLSMWKVVYAVQTQHGKSQKLLKNGQSALYFLAEAILLFIHIEFYHWANNYWKYADGFYNSMINDKNSHIPLPLIMFTCTPWHHALLEWQENKGVHLKALKANLKVDRPNCLNYIN